MADRIVAGEKADRTPDWDTGLAKFQPELWQCVARSLNINPDTVDVIEDPWTGTVRFENVSVAFHLRLREAREKFGKNGELAHPRYTWSSLPSFARRARGWGWDMRPEVREMADIPASVHEFGVCARADKQESPMFAEGKPTAPAAGHDTAADAATSKHRANPFTFVAGLTWADISITFTGPESVRVRARDRHETFTFDAMGFRHRRSHIAKPNECWKTFFRLAIVSTSNKTWNDFPRTPDLRKRISRLRDQLRRFFGITDDPITFRKGVGYRATFTLIAEEHVIQDTRERYTDGAGEDEGDDIQGVMSEVPGKWSR